MPAFITDEVFEVRFIIPIISLYLTANGAVAYLHSVHVQLEIERRNFTSRNKETAQLYCYRKTVKISEAVTLN